MKNSSRAYSSKDGFCTPEQRLGALEEGRTETREVTTPRSRNRRGLPVSGHLLFRISIKASVPELKA